MDAVQVIELDTEPRGPRSLTPDYKPSPEPEVALRPEPADVREKPGEIENGDEKEEKPGRVGLFKLFRYATPLDLLLMLIATLAAIGHGAALPGLMLVFGDLTNSFINQATSQALAPLNDDIVNCSATFPDFIGDTVRNATDGELDCDLVLSNDTTFESILQQCINSQAGCLDNDAFIDEINRQILTFIGIGLGVLLLAYFQITLYQIADERQVHKIRLLFYQAVLRQNVGWFDSTPSGELASRLSDDIDKIHTGIGDKVALFIQWIAVFVGGFVVGFIRDWRLTLLLLAFTPFLAIAGGIMVTLITAFTSQEQKQYASAGAVATEVLSSIRTVVAFGGEMKEAKRYDEHLKEARRIGTKKGVAVGLSFGFVFFLIFLVDSAAFWFGGFLVSEEITQGGDVLGVFFAVLIGAFALGQAVPHLEGLFTAAGAATVVYDIIDRVPPIDWSSDEGLVPEKFDSTIEFNNVSFAYPTRPDVQVLTGLKLKVEVGQTVALVGPSGCGKSTTVQLLQRFYDPADGEILVGGKDTRTLNLKWLRSNIGLVSQEPVLFDTTIAENIRYGKENATLEDIKEAAKDANAHNFISELPNGYNTLVGERGTQLSGGQKQRIAIARALVRDPKILLLDEATSALDTESEAIVQAALDHAREGRTTIVIAHRLSTIQNADIIASIDDGCVVEMGTHAELMANEGLYYELVTAQSYAADEAFAVTAAEKGHPRRLLSSRGSRHRSRKDSEGGLPGGLLRQVSLQRQGSVFSEDSGRPEFSRQISEKKQKEWDKDIPEVPLIRVIKVNSKEWWVLILGMIGAAVNGGIFPMFGLLLGEVLEVFARPVDEVLDAIHLWGALFFLVGIVSGVGVFLKVLCFTVAGEGLTSRLRSRAFKAILRQEVGWFDHDRNSSGALTTRLANDAAQVQGATGTRLGTLFETSFGLVLALLIAFRFSWLLTLVILGVVPLLILGGIAEVRALTGNTIESKKSFEKAGKIAVDSIDSIRTVAALGVEGTFFQQYKLSVKKPYRRAVLNSSVYGITYAFSQSIIYLMYAVVFRFGAFQVTRDAGNIAHVSFQDVFRVFIALIFGAVGVGQAGAFAPDYTKARLSANRIFAILDRVPVIDGYSEEGSKIEKVDGQVAVRSVEFSYPARPQVKVLQGLSVSVKSGQTLALVGPSGCGKSTVVALIERFYDPQSGDLTLDGNDLREVNIRWLRSQIGIVSQEPVLLDASIADNIRYGANFREVSDVEVIEAAKAANIHSFIESIPQGYNTNVGTKGTQLSGGQKQRIAIARALVRDPKILLLDEATSALDTESEKIVQEALDKAREGRTCIVIAHRLSTIYNADCIAVIKDGKVVEQGTHSELLANKDIYYQLNRFQMVESAADEAMQ